jgi:hypothetical protein
MNMLRKMGAHRIIRAYVVMLMLGSIVFSKLGNDWLSLWAFVLVLISAALILFVIRGDVGSTWKDKE